MSRLLVNVVIFVGFAVSATGCASKGESLAKQVCGCYEAAGSDLSKKMKCVTKQTKLQKQLNGDTDESLKYARKVMECVSK